MTVELLSKSKIPRKKGRDIPGLDVSIMANETTTKNEQGSFEPFNIDDIPWEQLPGRGTVRIRATREVLKIPKSQGHRNRR
jgi:hypothetical protein